MSDRNRIGESEDEIEISPWPVRELVGRLAVFGALGQRLALELNAAESEDLFDLETDRFDLHAWSRVELPFAAGRDELDLLETAVGRLSGDALDQCVEATIGASTIGWALRLSEAESLPIDVNGALEQDVLIWTPAPWDQVRQVVKRARLRSDDDLATELQRWELVLWRLSLFADPIDLVADREALAGAITEIAPLGLLPMVDDDLAMESGESFGSIDPAMLDELRAVAEIRLKTLNWISGRGPTWHETSAYID